MLDSEYVTVRDRWDQFSPSSSVTGLRQLLTLAVVFAIGCLGVVMAAAEFGGEVVTLGTHAEIGDRGRTFGGTGHLSERSRESFTADAEESFPAVSQATGRMRATVGSR